MEQYGLENYQEVTKTEKTKDDYFKKAIQLVKKAKRELNIDNDDEIDVRQLVIWLIEHKPKISRSSWRYYKSSVMYYLEIHEDIDAANEAMGYLSEVTSIGALTHTEKTSSLKMKKISFEDWNKLDTYLEKKNRKWYSQLRVWLRASIITGLRPIEWQKTKYIDHNGEPALEVKNAKSTNGRAHGETRTLILKNVKREDLLAIREHLNNVVTFVGMDNYQYFYNGCSIALYKVCRKLWPRRKRHITLYSTRHQFSANAKSSGFSRMEIAALMGHAVDITATIHYGKKLAGNEELSISPLQDDVDRVRHIDTEGYGDQDKIHKKQDNLL